MATGAATLTNPDPVRGFVVESRSLSPHFSRVVIEAVDLDVLELPHDGDTAVGIYFGDDDSAAGRTYTVRYHDPRGRRIVVDVLLHGDGLGTDWVGRVSAGDTVTLAHANSWYRLPADADWQVLAADMAGLPALARILDDPTPLPTTVLVEILDEDDLEYLPDHVDARWITSIGTGNGVAGSVLTNLVTDHVRAAGRGYCWFVGEAEQARAVRKHLRRERRWEPDRLDVMAYWRRDSEAWNSRFAKVGPALYEAYQKALGEGRSVKEAAEQFDEALEREGL